MNQTKKDNLSGFMSWLSNNRDQRKDEQANDFESKLDVIDILNNELHNERMPSMDNFWQRDSNLLFNLFNPLPSYSGVLGICADGMPLVMDLTEPSPGAILISGQPRSGKTKLLRSMLLATCQINSVDELIFYMITPRPGEYRDLFNLDQCMGLMSAYDRLASELIVDLAALAEQRRSGRHLGAKTILVIDDLYEFLKPDEFEVTNHLKWLLKHGSKNGIWLFAALSTEKSALVDSMVLEGFRTQIHAGSDALQLPNQIQSSRKAQPGETYRTRIGQQWVYFWLPA